jgi:hypothetical protein
VGLVFLVPFLAMTFGMAGGVGAVILLVLYFIKKRQR